MIFVGTHDHRMLGGCHVVADQQLFVKLLTGAQSGKFDRNIAMQVLFRTNAQARQVNHLLGEFDDLHWLAHVQNEHIAALPHGTRLDHQLRGFGDRHEIASDFRVGDRQGPTGLDLAMKQRNHRARRSQHVTKTHHGETGLVHPRHIGLVAEQHRGDFVTECLQGQLGQDAWCCP